MSWYITVLKKYAVFSGRARRKEYWMFSLFNAIFVVIAMIIDAMLDSNEIVYIIYALAMFIPSLAVSVRRLHDIGKSGMWIIISLIPIIGTIWMLILTCTDGDQGTNMYGEDPKEEIIV